MEKAEQLAEVNRASGRARAMVDTPDGWYASIRLIGQFDKTQQDVFSENELVFLETKRLF